MDPCIDFILNLVRRYAVRLIPRVTLTEELICLTSSLVRPPGTNRIKGVFNQILKQYPVGDIEIKIHPPELGNDSSTIYTVNIIGNLSSHYSSSTVRIIEKKVKQCLLEEVRKEIRPETPPMPDKIHRISSMCDLAIEETNLLLFFIAVETLESLREYLQDFSNPDKLQFISVSTCIPKEKIHMLLRTDGKLVRNNLIMPSMQEGMDQNRPFFSATDSLIEYLDGIADEVSKTFYIRQKDDVIYPIDTFAASEKDTKIITHLFKSSNTCNILLYGEPGAGKTEYARSIADCCGRELFFLEHEQYRLGRLGLFEIAINAVDPDKAVLAVDEADKILNGSTGFFSLFSRENDPDSEKGKVNDILDNHGKKVIWITNEINRIDDSILRRFSYSVRFSRTSTKQRQYFWEFLINGYQLRDRVSSDEIPRLARRYRVNAGHIGTALKTFSTLPKESSSIQFLESILDQQESLLEKGKLGANRYKHHDARFDVRYLNTEQPVDQVLQACNQSGEEGFGTNILICGLPGTGKSEFARYIASVTGRELIVKRSSDIQEPWVGKTEQNIRDAFEEAEKDKAVLCIDEADSFFSKRENALRSWEVSFTNEILTQMEHFGQIFICSTNLPDLIDHAAMRRFSWKITFLPLKKEHKSKIVTDYFPDVHFDKISFQRISSLPELTAGDVKCIWLKFRNLTDHITPGVIVEALKDEVTFRNSRQKTVGFLAGSVKVRNK